jgi:hypothetical protein
MIKSFKNFVEEAHPDWRGDDDATTAWNPRQQRNGVSDQKKAGRNFDPTEFDGETVDFGVLPDGYEKWTDAQKWMHHYITKLRDEESKRSLVM